VDNCVGAIATTGTEGEGYLDAVAYVRCGPSYSPTDAVLARLEASGSVIAWANGADGVLSLTSIVYAAGSVTFGDVLDDVSVDLEGTPVSIEPADFDGNGFSDVVATIDGSSNINVLLGDGSAGFLPQGA